MVAQSSVEAKYHGGCSNIELVWIKRFLRELKFEEISHMELVEMDVWTCWK